MPIPTDTSVPSELAMAWQCMDCGETGAITARFPIHPDGLAEQVWLEHRKAIGRRYCMCPAHYLKFWPIKT